MKLILKLLYRAFVGWWYRPDRTVRQLREVARANQCAPIPENPHRAAQRAWGEEFQERFDRVQNPTEEDLIGAPGSSADGHSGIISIPLTPDSPGLPPALKLRPPAQNGAQLIDAECLADCNESGRTDNSEFPAYMLRLLEEAKETLEGKFVRDKQKAAEKYAERKGVPMEKLPKVAAHVRRINPNIVNSATMSLFDKPDPQQPGATPDGASPQQRVVTLLKHLFREFAEYNAWNGEQMRKAKMKDFVTYAATLNTRWYHEVKEREALKAGYHLTDQEFEAVWQCFQDPWDAMALLHPLWHMMALSGQPPVKHIPEFLHIAVTMAWHPGSASEKALQIQVPTKWKPNSPMTNGFLCSLMKDQMDGIIQTFAGNGLDVLYEKYAVPTSDPGKAKSLPPSEKTREGSGF